MYVFNVYVCGCCTPIAYTQDQTKEVYDLKFQMISVHYEQCQAKEPETENRAQGLCEKTEDSFINNCLQAYVQLICCFPGILR